jgi:SM-20-related protein
MTGERGGPLLNLAALRTATLHSEPCRWGVIRDCLFAAPDLSAGFPGGRFTDCVRLAGEKPYRLATRPLVEVGVASAQAGELAPLWRQLTVELQAGEYRAAMTELTGLDLGSAAMTIALWRYPPAGFLAPHLDESYKIVSHVIYFNEAWNPGWGGHFQILDPQGVEIDRVVPRLGNSVVIVRSDRSWHGVAPVTEATPPRKSLQIVFHAGGGSRLSPASA